MDRDKQERDRQASEPAKKKAYRRPEILYREPLEASAVVCNQPLSKSNPGACPSGPISS